VPASEESVKIEHRRKYFVTCGFLLNVKHPDSSAKIWCRVLMSKPKDHSEKPESISPDDVLRRMLSTPPKKKAVKKKKKP